MTHTNITNFNEGIDFVVDAVLEKIKPVVVLIAGSNRSLKGEFNLRVLTQLEKLGYKGGIRQADEDLRVELNDVTLSFLLLDTYGSSATADDYVRQKAGRVLDLRIYVGEMPNDDTQYDLIVPNFR